MSRARLNLFIEPDHARRLDELAAMKGLSKSSIVAAALASFLSPDSGDQREAAIAKRLDRLSRQFDKLLGSGMNYHKKGLKKLLEAIIDGQIGRLVITHKDRLLRFGAELVFAICEAKQVEVVILNQGEDTTFEEDLAKDVLEIVTVFSARLYGSRSRKNQKLLDGVKKAVEESQC